MTGARWRYQPKAAWFVFPETGIKKDCRDTGLKRATNGLVSPGRDPSHGQASTFTDVHEKDTNIITW